MTGGQNDYADVIDALDYTQGLAEHVDIPQSDAGIIRIIEEKGKENSKDKFRVLDLGCGPGRLTRKIGEALENIPNAEVVGLDISSGFIKFANEHETHKKVLYLETDFLKENFSAQKFNIILMQGLVHHVPKTERKAWLMKCKELITENGILVIGDEFIPDYSSEEDRVINVVGLYAYVIANALRSNHQSLADIEAKNMIDDVSSGLPGAGHSDEALLQYIQKQSAKIYKMVLEDGTRNKVFKDALKTVADYIKNRSLEIAKTNTKSHDRGDYKISIERQIQEMQGLGMKIASIKKYGPTDWLGGMGVLVFQKV